MMTNSTLNALLSSTVSETARFDTLPIGTIVRDRYDNVPFVVVAIHNNHAIVVEQTDDIGYNDQLRTYAVRHDGTLYEGVSQPYFVAPKIGYVGVLETLNESGNPAVDLIVENAKSATLKITTIKLIRALTGSGLTDSKNAYEEINRYGVEERRPATLGDILGGRR